MEDKASKAMYFTVCGMLVAALVIAGACASRPGAKPMMTNRVALIAPVHAGEQGEAMRLGAEAAAREFDMELVYVPFLPEEGELQQLEAALRILQGGTAALLIDPADEEILRKVGVSGVEYGTPVIALNEERLLSGVESTIAINNEEAGRKAGEALAELLSGKGEVVLLKSDRQDPGMLLREKSIRVALQQYPSIVVRDSAVCGNLRDDCKVIAKGMLDGGIIAGAITLQPTASLGLVDELKRRDWDGAVKLVAFGSDTEQLELLQEGVIHQLIVQSDYSVGYIGIEQAAAIINGIDLERSRILETKVMNADNMFWMNNQKLLFPFVH